jgi:dTDP-4-dehydrorhamnose reductase
MKILLLGEKGYLGSYILDNLDVDILEKRNIYNNGKKYDYIINCIGKPNLEYCELNKQETDYSNRDILKDIIKFYPKSKIINFSSYYVYNDEGMCNEQSKTIFQYNYTRQKLEGENIIFNNGISFRIGKLFGHMDLFKQDKLTEYIIKNNDITLDTIYFNPTSLKQVLDVIKYEIDNNIFFGIYNLSNDGYTNHYDYGLFINDKLNSNKNITKINKINRSFVNYGKFLMTCDKIKKLFQLRNWKEDMIYYLENIKINENTNNNTFTSP